MKDSDKTLGSWLSERGPHERKRGAHAMRSNVEDEFRKLWRAQEDHHPILKDDAFRARIFETIFFQRPVFWRKNTLGECRFMPGEDLCPKGAWLSAQRRMLEKLNNLEIEGGNRRPLDDEERAAILAKLQTQGSMTWGAVRTSLGALYKARGEPGTQKSLQFNLERGGDKTLLGNPVEQKLSAIFGEEWDAHPHKQPIREAVQSRLWSADYGEIGPGDGEAQRVVILPAKKRAQQREAAAWSFIEDFGVTPNEAEQLKALTFPTGWDAFSTKALRIFLPELEKGERFGTLVSRPEWQGWRNDNFPNRDQPTGEILDRLPSPTRKNPDELRRIKAVRNPTVVRTQNELRKVVNNLIGLYGKPDLIRIELTRDVGTSKRDRDAIKSVIRKNEKRRKDAKADLEANGLKEPSREAIEKWLLWQECKHICPYSGDSIGFDDLFGHLPRFDVEHIWPRWKSFDNSYKNKTLCRKDLNIIKSNKTPFEAFPETEEWQRMKERVWTLVKEGKMSRGKARRFCDERPLPDDFAARQLTDTGYAARQIMAQLKRLWPDVGPEAPVTVQAVSGRVTAQLRKIWTLNNILADDGEKTRADHRHHAVDALAVACIDPGITNRLSRYWQARNDPHAQRPDLPPPWPTIREDAEKAVGDIVVSHRVRKKVSGPLHKETTYGDTQQDVTTKTGTYRQFVTRKKVEALTKGELGKIRDDRVRNLVEAWVAARGGDPKKAFPPYPAMGEKGPEIRKVRLLTIQQIKLMAPASTGYADLGSNHHIAIFRMPNGKVDCEVVSLFEASRRLAQREPVVQRAHGDGSIFLMSLSPGDTIHIPGGKRAGLWVVQGVWAAGPIVLHTHRDAEGSSVWRPTAGSLIATGATKKAIDPIGRIHSAND